MAFSSATLGTSESRTLRILAISPRFAPVNSADSHRIRLLLRHAAACGWQVEVLAVDPADVHGPDDPWLVASLPTDIPIHRVKAWNTRFWGFNGLAQRSAWPLYRKGCKLIAGGNFDLVFFSTTEFALHVLGPAWQARYGIPFCMDFQDPWVSSYYHQNPQVPRPGGRLKFAISHFVHRAAESYVVKACSGFLSVSEAYLDDLKTRYGAALVGKPMLVRGFPAEPAEFVNITSSPKPSSTPPVRVWRYVGRGGADMHKSARAFFQAWQQATSDGLLRSDDVRFEAIGTSYADANRQERTLAPLLAGTPLAGCVSESPGRVGYRQMLELLAQSDALVVFGSDDPSYTASKIYPYLASGKPLLAIFNVSSSVVPMLRAVGGGVCVPFDNGTTTDQLATAIYDQWFKSRAFDKATPLDLTAFEPFTARAQAEDLRDWFAEVIANA